MTSCPTDIPDSTSPRTAPCFFSNQRATTAVAVTGDPPTMPMEAINP